MSYIIYGISWFLAVFIHANTLKRNSLQSIKEAIISEVYSLLETNKDTEQEELVKETTFAHKFSRIEGKVKEFNSICREELISTTHDEFSNLFTFDIAEGCQGSLTMKCYDAVDYVDRVFHKKIQNKYSILYLNRYEILGAFTGLLSVHLMFSLISKFFE